MSNADNTTVKLIERVRVVKTDLDHPERPPEIVEQETVSEISLDQAALLGFLPGQGFLNPMQQILPNDCRKDAAPPQQDGPPPPQEGAKVGDA